MYNDSIKALVKEIQEYQNNYLQGIGMEEIVRKKKLILIRSAKQELLEKFLNVLAERNYRGKLYIIGRAKDRKYIGHYEQLDLRLFEVPEEQRYSTENTREYIDWVNADGICFLYQTVISDDYINLLEILTQAECQRYAISNQLQISKVENLERNLAGRKLYIELCNWFYHKREN